MDPRRTEPSTSLPQCSTPVRERSCRSPAVRRGGGSRVRPWIRSGSSGSPGPADRRAPERRSTPSDRCRSDGRPRSTPCRSCVPSCWRCTCSRPSRTPEPNAGSSASGRCGSCRARRSVPCCATSAPAGATGSPRFVATSMTAARATSRPPPGSSRAPCRSCGRSGSSWNDRSTSAVRSPGRGGSTSWSSACRSSSRSRASSTTRRWSTGWPTTPGGPGSRPTASSSSSCGTPRCGRTPPSRWRESPQPSPPTVLFVRSQRRGCARKNRTGRGQGERVLSSSTSSAKRTGSSCMVWCPIPGSTRSTEPGIESASTRAWDTGVSRSAEPTTTMAGTFT